jgi:hypothetical protein
MPFWLVPLTFAGEPVVVGSPDPRAPSGLRGEVVLPWSVVGLEPKATDAPAIGPDFLTLGPDGLAAVYDPLGKRVIVVGEGAFPVPAATDLAFTDDGVLLVLDDSARSLRAYDIDGALLGERPFPAIVPAGGSLGIDGVTACSVDVFGNCHALATLAPGGALDVVHGPSLRAPARQLVRDGATLRVDGKAVVTLPVRGGGRLLGDWLLVETMDDGTASRRALPVDGGAAVTLPVRGRVYTPQRDVAVGPDGDLGWLDPRADGLHLVRVSP